MKVGFLGLGAMGSRMAARAVEAGLEVVVFNRTRRDVAGATTASTPAEAADADVVISMLTGIEASRAVWEAAKSGFRPGSIAVECSTVTPAHSRWLAESLPVPVLEAPVVGTRPHADVGGLRVLVGGSAEAFERVRPALEAFGKPVLVGPLGSAMALKLAINGMFASQVAVLGEVLALLASEDLSLERSLDLLEGTPVFPPVLGGVAALLRAGDDAPRFPVDLVAKDLRYAQTVAEGPLLGASEAVYAAASARGEGDANLHVVARPRIVGV